MRTAAEGGAASWLEVDQYVEAFESVRAASGPVPSADYLPAEDSPLYLPVLRELACLEMEYSWSERGPRRLQELARDFPLLLKDRDTLQAVAFEEYRLRLQAGEHP